MMTMLRNISSMVQQRSFSYVVNRTPRSDIDFKRLFRKKEAMISFLNAVFPSFDIKDVDYCSGFPRVAGGNDCRFNLRAQRGDKSFFIVEFEKSDTLDQHKQWILSSCHEYCRTADAIHKFLLTKKANPKTHFYSMLNPVHSIVVYDPVPGACKDLDLLIPNLPVSHLELRFKETETTVKDFSWTFLRLDHRPAGEPDTSIDRWLRLLTTNVDDVVDETNTDPGLTAAYELISRPGTEWTQDEKNAFLYDLNQRRHKKLIAQMHVANERKKNISHFLNSRRARGATTTVFDLQEAFMLSEDEAIEILIK